MPRAAVLLLAVALGAACGPSAAPPPPDSEATLAAAAAWLWARQASDGGWHSDTYGLLRSGQSLTPFVLNALLAVPGRIHPADSAAVDRAVSFLASHIDADGGLGRADLSLEDYPTYATSLAVSALVRSGGRERELPARLLAWLRGRQFTEALGWKPGDATYGGWGMGGVMRPPPDPGHVDLSMTRHALEALAAMGAPPDDPAFARAAVFLGRAAGADGGFHFSPVVEAANKAGREGSGFRSYGTATADGLLALLAAGAPPADPRVTAARDWLVRNHRLDRVPGIAPHAGHDWGGAMVHYYRSASARAFRALHVEQAPAGHDWRAELAAALVREQRPDGSFATEDFLMKEDDPLIATALAVLAMTALRD